MARKRFQYLALWVALLAAAWAGGAPTILCVGPDGHAAVEDLLCGSFEDGTTFCAPFEAVSASVPSEPGFPCLQTECGDRCTDTLLHLPAVSAAPPHLVAPLDASTPPRVLDLLQLSLPSWRASVPQPAPGGPPIPFERRTALLI